MSRQQENSLVENLMCIALTRYASPRDRHRVLPAVTQMQKLTRRLEML